MFNALLFIIVLDIHLNLDFKELNWNISLRVIKVISEYYSYYNKTQWK